MGYAYCAGFWRASKQLGPLPFRLWSLHSRLLTREKNSTASFFHHFRQYSRSISGEGKSRLAGNYEAAVLLRPQSPCDFYGPFQRVVRNRTTVQYHKKRKKKKKKNIPAVSDDPWHARFLRSILENAEYYKLWRTGRMGEAEKGRRRKCIKFIQSRYSRTKEILFQINFNEWDKKRKRIRWNEREKKSNPRDPTNSSSSVSLAKLCSRIESA